MTLETRPMHYLVRMIKFQHHPNPLVEVDSGPSLNLNLTCLAR